MWMISLQFLFYLKSFYFLFHLLIVKRFARSSLILFFFSVGVCAHPGWQVSMEEVTWHCENISHCKNKLASNLVRMWTKMCYNHSRHCVAIKSQTQGLFVLGIDRGWRKDYFCFIVPLKIPNEMQMLKILMTNAWLLIHYNMSTVLKYHEDYFV